MQAKAIIIGSDCPEINSPLIQNAFKDLHEFDAVIGPTPDGGYYLLGLKTLHHELFENIPWSTDQVFNKTIEKMQSLELRFKILDELSDLDTKEDLDKFPFLLA